MSPPLVVRQRQKHTVLCCNEQQTLESKTAEALDKGAADAETIVRLNANIRKLEADLKLTRAEVKNLEGLGEMDRAEIEGLMEDLAVQSAGWEAEAKEKEEVRAEAEQRAKERDEANDQLEFLEAELEGVKAEEQALRAEVKAQNEELQDLTNARDDLDDEVRRLKELSGAQQVEATQLRTQLSELRAQHTEALQDASRYQVEAERHGEKAGQLAAQASAAVTEAERLRKWHDWAKSAEVTSLQGELDVVKQERDMLQRDLQSKLAEHRRISTQCEEYAKDVKALRSDLFAREGRLGRVEAELAAAHRATARGETDLVVAREQLDRRQEELQLASVSNVKLRGKSESDKLRAQAALEATRAAHKAEMTETRSLHAAELEAARRDAAAAWRLAKELETRVLSQTKVSTANTQRYSKAMQIGRRIEKLEAGGGNERRDDENEAENDRLERELERELQLRPP